MTTRGSPPRSDDFFARRRARLHQLLGVFATKAPVFLYQMGKVGSTAIETSLRAAGVPVRHFHYLGGDFTDQFHFRRAKLRFFKRVGLQLTGAAQRCLLRLPGPPVRVITLVREPMARNVAAFFQLLRHVAWEDRGLDTRRDVDSCAALGQAFHRLFRHDAPMRWIERELGRKLGIDVYAYPFSHQSGYALIERRHLRLLILRMEDLDRCWDVVGDFVGHRGLRPSRVNLGEKKWYGPLLREFRAGYAPPGDLLDQLYVTRYMRHFYSEEEIARFRRQWLPPVRADTPRDASHSGCGIHGCPVVS